MTKSSYSYQIGDTLRKSIKKEVRHIINLIKNEKNGTILITERVWVKKIDEECFDWGCR